jgi:copper chaperone CopZ
MNRLVISGALLLMAVPAFAADSVKVTVGHMCCGSCKTAATAGIKTLPFADTVTIDGAVATVTAKADQKVDVIALRDALSKAGFPAKEIMVSGPVTLTVAHMCCAGCANDLKAGMAQVRSARLDKDKVAVDQAAKTITVQPLAGMTMNLIPILHQMENAGYAASKGTIQSASLSKPIRAASR